MAEETWRVRADLILFMTARRSSRTTWCWWSLVLGGDLRVLRVSRTDAGVCTSYFGKLPDSRSDRGAAVGARQHREVRRRSRQCHDFWTLGRVDRCAGADGFPARARAFSACDWRKWRAGFG